MSVALAHAAAWVPLRSDVLDALISGSLPAAHHPGAFADSPLGQFLRAHADRPLVLWYAGNLIELDPTGPETLLETARQQLLESAPLGGELYLNHAPHTQREVSSQRATRDSESSENTHRAPNALMMAGAPTIHGPMSRAADDQRPMTAEAFAALSLDGRAELVDGVVARREDVPGAKHSRTAVKIAARLEAWAERGDHGPVLAEAGYIVRRSPDRVRLPDVSFVRGERLPELPDGYLELVPDLAVEIVSPNDKANDLEQKLEDYRQLAVPMTWVVHPVTRTVIVHTADGIARILRGADVLRGGDILPGFECPISAFFA
ncbi:MAG: Uma2 family endonuclease [Myxococcales bacterium]|nr:Uma2 family endonuclease [Myxococcales bacterium]